MENGFKNKILRVIVVGFTSVTFAKLKKKKKSCVRLGARSYLLVMIVIDET